MTLQHPVAKGGDWLQRGAMVGASVLAMDPALESSVPRDRRDAARRTAMARIVHVAAGASVEVDGTRILRGGFGLLVLDGVLLYEVGMRHRYAADLLTCGDLVPADCGVSAPTAGADCRALTPARLAVLGPRWVERIARFPELDRELVTRVIVQSRRLAVLMALTNAPHLEVRLWGILWILADRLGRVHPDGVHIDVPLTHDVLAALSRARRPSISTALAALAERRLLRREHRGWVLLAGVEAGPRPRPRASPPPR